MKVTSTATAAVAEPALELLASRVQRGDEDAMQELYEIFSKGIRFMLYRQLGPEDLDDKVHDVFVTIAQSIRNGELRDPSRLMVLDSLGRQDAGWQQFSAVEARARKAQRGDIIRVLSNVGIARPLDQQSVLVTISGEVAKPGRYYFRPGTRLADVVAQAVRAEAAAVVPGVHIGGVAARSAVRVSQSAQASAGRGVVKAGRPAVCASTCRTVVPSSGNSGQCRCTGSSSPIRPRSTRIIRQAAANGLLTE